MHAAVGTDSVAYVTQDGHLHVAGGVLGLLFAEGPCFPGAEKVYCFDSDDFLVFGLDGKLYAFGNNKTNTFELKDKYCFRLNFRAADDPEILEVMRQRKDDFGKVKKTVLFADIPSYWAWEREMAETEEVRLLAKVYKSNFKLAPGTRYDEDGSPLGMFAYALVSTAYVIRPEDYYMNNDRMGPDNVLYIACPLPDDYEVLKEVDPGAHKKAIYIKDENRWFMLDGTELYILHGSEKTVVAKDIADISVSYVRVLILTTSGQIFQSSWRRKNAPMIEGALRSPGKFPLASLPDFRKRQTGGFLGKAFNALLDNEWEEIKWKP